MPRHQHGAEQPRLRLVRLLDRLTDRNALVTFADLEQAASRPSSRLHPAELSALLEEAVGESLILKDLRTFYDRASGSYSRAWVYRVNARHPLAQELLAE